MINTIAQFIPIVVIYTLLSQYQGCISFSHTILGKLLAVSIIIFYASIDKTVGLFACALIILFYQMDCVENTLNLEAFHDIPGKTAKELHQEKDVPKPKSIITKHAKSSNNQMVETFEDYNTMYPSERDFKPNETIQSSFREQNCKDGVLKYKNMTVNNDMASHIFPEIRFKDDYCNVCNSSCKFSIIEAKFRSEKKIQTE
jgi:hypothetical protein